MIYASLKTKILASGLSVSELVSTAWASASTFRGSDLRGGANGARIRLAPQKDWEVNEPCSTFQSFRKTWKPYKVNLTILEKLVSLADLIVLGGCAGIESAAEKEGVRLLFRLRLVAWMLLKSRPILILLMSWNLWQMVSGIISKNDIAFQPKHFFLDRAQLLTLTGAEMTALIGGLRVLGANYGIPSMGSLQINLRLLVMTFLSIFWI